MAAGLQEIQALLRLRGQADADHIGKVSTPMQGQLAIITGAAAAANSYGALLTLVLNGYGHDAVRIARSIYEAEINILWLKNHPADVEDFVDYNIIQQKAVLRCDGR